MSPFAQVLKYHKHKLYIHFSDSSGCVGETNTNVARNEKSCRCPVGEEDAFRGERFRKASKGKGIVFSVKMSLQQSLLDIDFQDSHREHSKDAIGKNHCCIRTT